MLCPFQTIVIHRPENTDGYVTRYAEDITKFAKCLKSECPYYQAVTFSSMNQIVESCRKVESEVNNESNKRNFRS